MWATLGSSPGVSGRCVAQGAPAVLPDRGPRREPRPLARWSGRHHILPACPSSARKFTYANVAATLALVFSMSGGALAAGHYLVNSDQQINPKVLKALEGAKGPKGATGAAGAGRTQPGGWPSDAGATGLDGRRGPGGLNGRNGLTRAKPAQPGATGTTGPQGVTGPKGATGEKGVRRQSRCRRQTGAHGRDGRHRGTGSHGSWNDRTDRRKRRRPRLRPREQRRRPRGNQERRERVRKQPGSLLPRRGSRDHP